MKQNNLNTLANLHNFLSDTDGLSKEEVAEELRTAGVDVDGFNSAVQSIVHMAHQKQAREILEVTPSDIRKKSRSEILQLLEQIKAGVFGYDVADMLAARQGDTSKLADEDLQALLQATLEKRQ